MLRNFKSQEAKAGVDRETRAVRHPEGAGQRPYPAVGSASQVGRLDKPVWNGRDFCRTVSLF